MNKMAFFVEGETELELIHRLLTELAEARHLMIETKRASGGKRSPRIYTLRASTAGAQPTHYFLIINSACDSRVKQDVIENYAGMIRQGFSQIIGVRDVYPDYPRHEIPRLRRGLDYGVKTQPFKPLWVLGIMEVEAWLLSESTHFPRIDPALTVARIGAELSFNPAVDDMELRDHPAQDLDSIYSLVHKRWQKTEAQRARTISALDIEEFYINTAKRHPDLEVLISAIDAFLDTPPSAQSRPQVP